MHRIQDSGSDSAEYWAFLQGLGSAFTARATLVDVMICLQIVERWNAVARGTCEQNSRLAVLSDKLRQIKSSYMFNLQCRFVDVVYFINVFSVNGVGFGFGFGRILTSGFVIRQNPKNLDLVPCIPTLYVDINGSF